MTLDVLEAVTVGVRVNEKPGAVVVVDGWRVTVVTTIDVEMQAVACRFIMPPTLCRDMSPYIVLISPAYLFLL